MGNGNSWVWRLYWTTQGVSCSIQRGNDHYVFDLAFPCHPFAMKHKLMGFPLMWLVGYLLDEWIVADGGKWMSNIMSLLSFLFSSLPMGATDSFGRVIQRERQRLLMALLKEMGCNLVLIHRYVLFRVLCFLSLFCLVWHLRLLKEIFYVQRPLIWYSIILLQLAHQGSYSQGMNYGNSQVTFSVYPWCLIAACHPS